MTPLVIIGALTALFEALVEVARLAQTPQGQALIEQSLKDRKKWDEFWQKVGKGIEKLFSGELFPKQKE